jgi:hypothetical protein
MIIPSMTLEEIRREIEKDYPILFRKMEYVAHDMNKALSKTDKLKGVERYFDYCSKYKNQWIYRICFTQKKIEFENMLLFHNGKGHAAICVSADMELIYHTGHFFQRFNERCNLGLKTIPDIIRAYMRENKEYEMKELVEVEPGIFKIFGLIKSGIILGMQNANLKLFKLNTFISNNMLSKNQNELKLMMLDVLEKYKHTSGLLN